MSPYTLHYNAGSYAEFDSFPEALAFYAEHRDRPHGAKLLGDGADWDGGPEGYRLCSDGLTEAEREQVEDLSR